ncbi:MAG: hypothetical protein AAF566_01755 [Pseudomonadota bacterium]
MTSRIWMLTPVASHHRELFLERLREQVREAPDPRDVRVVAVLQTDEADDARRLEGDARAILPDARVLHQAVPGVSRARNRALKDCLARASARDFVIFRDCRSVLETRYLEALQSAPITTDVARVSKHLWTEGFPRSPASVVSVRQHYDIIGRSSVSTLAFRPLILEGMLFPETMGPGRDTGIKSGEDTMFLSRVFSGRGDWSVRQLPGAVFQMPRTDLTEKHRDYADGQVCVSQILMQDRRLPLTVRTVATLRLGLFALATLRFLRPGGGEIFRARLKALTLITSQAASEPG